MCYNGEPLFMRYNQIRSILGSLGGDFQELLAEPVEMGDKFSWKSGFLASPVAMSSLQPGLQARYKADVSQLMAKIKAHSDKLRGEGQREAADVIDMAVSVSSYDHIFVEDRKVVFAVWGFTSAFPPDSGKSVNVLSAIIPGNPSSSEPTVAPEPPVAPEPQNPETAANGGSTFVTNSADIHSAEKHPVSDKPTTLSSNNDDNNSGQKSRLPGWLWFLLGVILTLLTVLLLRSCGGDHKCGGDCNMQCGDSGCSCGSSCADGSCGGYHGGNGQNNGGSKNGGYTGGDANGGNYPPHRPNDPYTPYDPNDPGDPFFDNIGVIPPVDRDRIIEDPEEPGERQILDNQVNVALDKGQDLRQFIEKVETQYPGEAKAVYANPDILLAQFQVPDSQWREWITKFKAMPEVKLAFPTSLLEDGALPADPGFRDPHMSWYFDDIQAPEAWDITMGDTSVIVAIADNCFDLSHPELADRIIKPYNVTTGDANVHLVRDEGNMHGTHVAGTAAGGINGQGVCGIAPKCKIMPIQLADENGMMTSLSVMAGALFAIHHGAAVINYSLGAYFGHISKADQNRIISGYGQDEAEFWNELFDFCNEENLVVVKAAGNEDILAECDPMSRTDKALIVCAYQGIDSRQSPKADFSNFGSVCNISAPGVEIYSSVPGGDYDFLQGTSMAAPVVTGAVALLKSQYPHLTSNEVIQILNKSAKPLDTRPEIGPLLQLADALRMAGSIEIMTMPENAADLSFAEGRWQSSTDLQSDDGAMVEVFFDLKADGTGTIEYLEDGVKSYKAPLKISLADGNLVIEQTANASNGNDDGYMKCVFTSIRQSNGAVLCRTVYDNETSGPAFHIQKAK